MRNHKTLEQLSQTYVDEDRVDPDPINDSLHRALKRLMQKYGNLKIITNYRDNPGRGNALLGLSGSTNLDWTSSETSEEAHDLLVTSGYPSDQFYDQQNSIVLFWNGKLGCIVIFIDPDQDQFDTNEPAGQYVVMK